MKKMTYIDSLKGWAILAVILVHSGAGAFPGIMGNIGLAGARGVQMFFLISAFLAAGSLERKFGQNRIDMKGARDWLLKKFFRIAPLYYIFLVVYFIAENTPMSRFLGGGIGENAFANIISHVFFLHALSPLYVNSIIGVAWYLGDLALMYFAMLLFYQFINSLEKSFAALTISLIAGYGISGFLAFLDLGFEQTVWGSYVWTFGFLIELPCMLLGVVLYYIFGKVDIEKIRNKKCFSFSILLGSLYLVLCLTTGYNVLGGGICTRNFTFVLIFDCICWYYYQPMDMEMQISR